MVNQNILVLIQSLKKIPQDLVTPEKEPDLPSW